MKKLEVGQSFEVVEVIFNPFWQQLTRRQGIILRKGIDNNYFQYFGEGMSQGALMFDHEIKTVGRLIIKSVKP